ncbi:MAG TPA: hypothetical protein VF157_02510, partial [Chloroflexota bacterium]
AYDTTGGQPTPGAGVVDFAALARDAGYVTSFRFDSVEALERELPHVLAAAKPALVLLKVASQGRRTGVGLKRTYDAFESIRDYLAQHPAP